MDLLCLSETNVFHFYQNLKNKKRNLIYIYNNGGEEAIRLKKKKFPTNFNQLLYKRYNVTVEDWVTLFYLIGRYGSYHLFSLLVELASPASIASDGSTLLHALSLNKTIFGESYLDDFIIKFKCDINSVDYFGRSCLYYTAYVYNFIGSNLDMVDREGNTPVQYRIKTGRYQGLDMIADHRQYDQLLNLAAGVYQDEIILSLIKISNLTSSQIIEGYLTLGARNMYGPMERYFFVRAIEHGWMNPNFYTSSDKLFKWCKAYIMLRYGEYGPQMEMFLLSVMYDSRYNAGTRGLFKEYMDSLLHPMCNFNVDETIFIKWGYRLCTLDIVSYTEQFIDLYPSMKFKNRLLFLANWFAHTLTRKKILPLLYRAINFRNDDDQTLLHLACNMTYTRYISPLKFVKLCLDMGADIDAKDKFGNTPLHYVTRNPNAQQKKMCELLLSRGAHQDVCNDRGRMYNICKHKVFPLKCLAARVVCKHYINVDMFPTNFVKFIKLH